MAVAAARTRPWCFTGRDRRRVYVFATDSFAAASARWPSDGSRSRRAAIGVYCRVQGHTHCDASWRYRFR
jgi:hypothetical protein